MEDNWRNEKEKEVRTKGLLQFRKYDEHLEKSLKNNEIIFGAAKNFNDPFDCNLPIDIDNPKPIILEYLKKINESLDFKKKLPELKELAEFLYNNKEKQSEKLREDINSNRRFTCFNISSNEHVFGNSLFWANYADKHHGICLKFDGAIWEVKESFYPDNSDFITPIPVDYRIEIPKFNYVRYRLGIEKGNSLQYNFGTKSVEWEKENEIRFIHERNKAFCSDYTKVKFRPSLLEKVYFGCNLEESEIEKLSEMFNSEKYSEVKLSRLVRSKSSFKLEEIIMKQ